MDLIPCWNGSLERLGICPGLSGYTGPSQLTPLVEMTKEQRAEYRREYVKLTKEQQLARQRERMRIKRRTAKTDAWEPTPGVVKDRLRRGYSVRQTAAHFSVPVSTIQRQAAKAGSTGSTT